MYMGNTIYRVDRQFIMQVKKRITLFLLLITASLGVFSPSVSASETQVEANPDLEWTTPVLYSAAYQVGESVYILWRGKWYPGKILAFDGGVYYITYDGYDSSWDEWVEPARLSR